MAWCPNCKYEYRDGILVCADCGATLVDELPAKTADYITEEALENSDVLSQTSIVDDTATDEKAAKDDDSVSTSQESETGFITDFDAGTRDRLDFMEGLDKNILNYILANHENPDSLTEDEILHLYTEFVKKMEENSKKPRVYQSAEEKSRDLQSSGITLLVVGSLGCIFIILLFIGLLPIHLKGIVSYILYSILGLFFVGFVVGGIVSLKGKKVADSMIKDEKADKKQIEYFITDNMTKENIDALNNFGTADDESIYFVRVAIMKKLISDAFPDVDDMLVDEIIDEKYSTIFEQN